MSMPTLPTDDAAEKRRCARWFWLWLISRTLLWTTVAALTRMNAPKDLIEMLGWGREWCWGYYKHPPLPAWLADACFRLAWDSLWGAYLGSYAMIGVAFWCAWRLAQQALPPRAALASVIALEAVHFFNTSADALNHNVALTTMSALTALACFHASQSGRLGAWFLAGLAAGGALLAKYNAIYLFAAIAGYFVFHPSVRHIWRTPGPYLAAIVAALVFAPHVLWSAQHGFPSLHYAMERVAATGSPWLIRLREPATFTFSQLAALTPLLLLLVFRQPRRLDSPQADDARIYLICIGFGPFVLYLTTAIVTGCHLHGPWGMPLWPVLGAAVLAMRSSPKGQAEFGRRTFGAALAIGAAYLVAFVAYNIHVPHLTPGPTRVHFPGREVARAVEAAWNNRFKTPLPMAAGDWWLAANVSCYASARPALYTAPDCDGAFLPETGVSSGLTDEDLIRRGGVLLWHAEAWGTNIPPALQARFPMAILQPPVLVTTPEHCQWPVRRFGLAVVPPACLVAASE